MAAHEQQACAGLPVQMVMGSPRQHHSHRVSLLSDCMHHLSLQCVTMHACVLHVHA